jgi:hypothetical protein
LGGGQTGPNFLIAPVLDTRPAFRYEFAGPGSRSGATLTNPPVLGLRPGVRNACAGPGALDRLDRPECAALTTGPA